MLDYRHLFEASANAYMVLDRELRYVEANAAYLQIAGVTKEQLLGRHVFDVFPDPNEALLRASFERVLATRERDVVADLAYRVPRLPGGPPELRIWSATHTPLLDARGEVEFIVQHTQDVGELHVVVARARFIAKASELTANAGEDIEDTLRRVAWAAVGDGFADLSFIDVFRGEESRRVVVAHADATKADAAARLARFPSPRALPATHAFRDIASGARLVADLTEDMLRTSTRGPEHAAALLELGMRSGVSVPLWHAGELFAVIVVGSSTRQLGPGDREVMVELGRIATIALDHARLSRERAALLASEQDARERAEAANRAKDEFLAMLGHELRNPLAPILTAVQLMRLRGEASSAREQSIIERQANHLVRLLDDLLDVARIARGKIELKTADVDIAHVVAKAVEIASPSLDQKGHKLAIDVPAHGLRVHGDEARLAQVIANLLANAARYTDEGGQVRLSAVREGDEIVVRVRDNGIGIAPEMLPRIFELFVQAQQPSDRPSGGLGLGLTLVRRLVEMHGGTATATSGGLGKGTELTVRLPALRAEPTITPVETRIVPDLTPGKRILIVDDNEDAAFLLSDLLARRGFEVHLAHDGLAGYQRAVDLRPDLAVIDIGLPSIDGYEVARRVHATMGAQAPRMIALTGYGGAAERAKSAESGFLAHLTKPIELGRLLALLDQPA